MTTLGDRMKNYEREFEFQIPPTSAYICRLDGKNFSKFTSKFNKPFDNRFITAMKLTMNDLVDKFNASTGYCHSDEITLIFPPVDNPELTIHMYNGRVVKLCSVLAGYCSVRFCYHINKVVSTEDSLKEHVNQCNFCFDCRMLSWTQDKLYEIVNHMIWRRQDCYRNAVSAYGRYILGHKSTHKKNSDEIIEMLLQNGVDWNDVPIHIKYGMYGKKEQYDKMAENGEMVKRSQIVNRSLIVVQNDLDLLLDKYWEGE